MTLDRTSRVVILLILGVGLLVRVLFLAVASEPALVRVVPDDAYYYFQVARNVVSGQGATFDGIHPTNGYHPLWMGALLPVAGVVRDPALFVRVALGLGVVLGFATAILLHRLVRRMTDVWWVPLLALILYWLNPRAVLSSLNGLETSLSTFLFTLLLWLTIREDGVRCSVFGAGGSETGHAARGTRHATLRAVTLGLSMGLLFLARTDNVFFVAVLWLAAVATAEQGQRLRRALAMAGAAAALAVPWVAYNWLAFGSPIQVSGLSVPYVHHELYRLQGHSGGEALAHGLKRFAVMLYEGLRGEIGYSRLISFPAIALSLLVFVVRWRREPAARRAILVLLGLGLAGLAHLFVHSAIRWYPRPWYFDQLLVLLPAMFALALSLLLSASSHASRITRHAPDGFLAALLIGLASAQTALSVDALARGEWPWAAEMLDSARWLRENTREDEVAASFNAGIIGYYSGRRVVNLDGAINNAAYEAIRRKDLAGLMREANVSHYLDFEPMTLAHFGLFLGDAAGLAKMPIVREFGRPETAWAGSHIQVRRLLWPPTGTQ
ncbi:MAG TPA: hypothetical protein PLE19_07860 [Planctomycetota bacterium]|nr:hypothetical protein [Planctomycetota bacterium]HRR78902.1 hypothetical protein [Planctomycetota bacterium]HRT92820.1 hypothetical protein [Planctomycetota bacterium]